VVPTIINENAKNAPFHYCKQIFLEEYISIRYLCEVLKKGVLLFALKSSLSEVTTFSAKENLSLSIILSSNWQIFNYCNGRLTNFQGFSEAVFLVVCDPPMNEL
jgi:hypothetical protein